MRKHSLQILFFLVLFFSVFYFSDKANASTLEDLVYDSSGGATTTTAFGQSFKPRQNNFKAVKISSQNDISAVSATLYLCSGQISQSSFSTTYNCTGSGQFLVAQQTLTPTCSFIGGLYRCTYTFTTSKAVNIGEQYYFSLKYATNQSLNWFYGSYADGMYASANNHTLPTVELYFVTYYDNTFIDFGIFWDINVFLPDQDWIYSSNKGMVMFKYSNLGGVYKSVWFNIDGLTGKDGTAYISMLPAKVNIASTTATQIEGAQFNLSNGYYRLTSAKFDGGGNNYLSTPIDFQVAGTSTTPFKNASTSLQEILNQYDETICNDIDTSGLVGQMICAFKKGALFVFKPSDSSVSSLITHFIEFKQAFPFNAFFGLTDALQAGVASTTGDTTFKIPFITATGTITTLPVMSSSTLSNFIGTTNNNLFRTSIVYFAWLIAGLMVYFTVRKI